jgi:hypothetical protein|tara:strand:- start:520 stop:828 length:309 start_codon:yes stop_codon:yes gene_type:complete
VTKLQELTGQDVRIGGKLPLALPLVDPKESLTSEMRGSFFSEKEKFMEKNMKFYFTVLDYIRKTGFMNMNGSPRYLRETFGLRKDEAHHVFGKWVESKRRSA